MEWLPLTLLCAMSLAGADALSKYLGEYRARELVVVRFGFCLLFLAPLLFMHPLPDIAPAFWGWIAILVPLEIAAMLLYMSAIRASPLALTLPYLAFTPVFVVATGYLILGERVTNHGFAGILLVVAGAWLLNAEQGDKQDGNNFLKRGLAPFRAIVRERGSRLMLCVAGIYGVTSVMGKGAMQYVPATFFGPFYYSFIGLVALLLFSIGDPRTLRVLARRPVLHLLLGGLMAIMVITHFLALERVEVAYMISVKRTSLLFGIALGAIFFREKHLGRRLAAGTLMVAGVSMIAL